MWVRDDAFPVTDKADDTDFVGGKQDLPAFFGHNGVEQ
jgi:hypothetical protein